MKQTLKISIVRGGCRFATPLYLGGEYALAFEGERADEAKTLLVTRPQKDRDGNLIALAKSETANDGGVSLLLNRQALVDWFGTCRAEDVDATVDAHVYVFDADSVVIADSDVTIEYRPVDFVISDKEFEKWSDHEDRIEVLEDASKSHDAAIADHEEDIASLGEADKANLQAAKDYAKAEDEAHMDVIRAEIDSKVGGMTSVQYVHEKGAATTGKTYHRVQAVQTDGVWTLAVEQERNEFHGNEGGDEGTYAMLEKSQTFSGVNTFAGSSATNLAKVVIGDNATLTATATKSGNDANAEIGTLKTAKIVARATSVEVPSTVVLSGTVKAGASVTVDNYLNVNLAKQYSLRLGWTKQLDDGTWSEDATVARQIDIDRKSGDFTFNAPVKADAFTGNLTGDVTGDTTGTHSGSVSLEGTFSVSSEDAEMLLDQCAKVTVPTTASLKSDDSSKAVSLGALAELLAKSRGFAVFGDGTTSVTTKTVVNLIPDAWYDVTWFVANTSTATYTATFYCYDGNGSSATRSATVSVASAPRYATRPQDAASYVKTSSDGSAKIGCLVSNAYLKNIYAVLSLTTNK